MKRLFIKTHYLEAERESFFFDLRALLEGAFGKEWKNIWLFCLMFCFSPHCRMDGRSKTFRPGERLVPLGTCGTNLQQTCTTEEPEGGTTCEECQAAGLLQEIRLYFVWTCTVSLPWGNHLFSIVPQKKHLCKEHNTALWQNWVLFAKESGNSIRKNHSFPVCHQDYGSSRRKKSCMYCLLCGNREGLYSDRGLGSGLQKIYSWFCHWQVAGPWASHFRILPQFSHLWNGGKLTYLTGCCEAKFTSISILRALSSWEGRC